MGLPTEMAAAEDYSVGEVGFDSSNFVVTTLGPEEVISSEGLMASESGETFATPMTRMAGDIKKRKRPTPSPKVS